MNQKQKAEKYEQYLVKSRLKQKKYRQENLERKREYGRNYMKKYRMQKALIKESEKLQIML
jgi:hypothetical protein